MITNQFIKDVFNDTIDSQHYNASELLLLYYIDCCGLGTLLSHLIIVNNDIVNCESGNILYPIMYVKDTSKRYEYALKIATLFQFDIDKCINDFFNDPPRNRMLHLYKKDYFNLPISQCDHVYDADGKSYRVYKIGRKYYYKLCILYYDEDKSNYYSVYEDLWTDVKYKIYYGKQLLFFSNSDVKYVNVDASALYNLINEYDASTISKIYDITELSISDRQKVRKLIETNPKLVESLYSKYIVNVNN